MKSISLRKMPKAPRVAPLAGAWIEISGGRTERSPRRVAPLAGAWIEINKTDTDHSALYVAPLAGAWIEIDHREGGRMGDQVAPLAGAWIEIPCSRVTRSLLTSHPSRVRGLKFFIVLSSLSIASVAPLAGAWIEICYRKGYRCKGYRRTPRGCVD